MPYVSGENESYILLWLSNWNEIKLPISCKRMSFPVVFVVFYTLNNDSENSEANKNALLKT